MIARARRAFPGMVVSLMLTAPLLAHPAAAQTVTETGRTNKTVAVKPNTVRKSAKAATPKAATVSKNSAAKPAGAVRSASTDGQTSGAAHPAPARSVARARVVPATSLGVSRPIHRTASHGAALIDDGTMWRERGSLATWQQTGVASWYGGTRWQGHRTSSGARYDQGQLTAAHATLPLGTRVRVTLHDNSARSVIVLINDRPGTRTRIIDLSREAAAQLGILDRGVAMVTLTPL